MIVLGTAYVIGLSVSYIYVKKAVDISLREAIAGPAASAFLAMAAYLAFALLVDPNVVHLALRVAVKGAFACGVFIAVMLALQPRRSMERISYVRRLATGYQNRTIQFMISNCISCDGVVLAGYNK